MPRTSLLLLAPEASHEDHFDAEDQRFLPAAAPEAHHEDHFDAHRAPSQPLGWPGNHQQLKELHPPPQVWIHSSKAEAPLKLPHSADFRWSLDSPQQAAECLHAQQ